MKTTKHLGLALTALTATLAFAGGALAQEEEQAGMALPPGGAQGAQGGSDHEAMVGRFAVGYLGRAGVPIWAGPLNPANVGTGTTLIGEVSAPVVGIRYWLDPMLGLDVGLGFASVGGGSVETESGSVTTTVDLASTTAFLLHGGVPLSLASSRHFSFQVVPELNVGFSSRTEEDPAPPQGTGQKREYGGFGIDLGARAGAEVHFGFMGIPELSLQGSVGVFFASRSASVTVSQPNTPETNLNASTTDITTTVGSNPWNIFTSNVSALYYF
ncbi:MAG: hypothetical protein IT376_23220 [Polyangiaceae bacterium]|nr:hypothetical protein [Polyangiaceae bacterium]